jgi:hypothetical protein
MVTTPILAGTTCLKSARQCGHAPVAAADHYDFCDNLQIAGLDAPAQTLFNNHAKREDKPNFPRFPIA